MLPAVALLPVADLLVDLLVVVLVAADHLGVLPVVLVVRALVGLLVGLLVPPEVLVVSGVAVAALVVAVLPALRMPGGYRSPRLM